MHTLRALVSVTDTQSLHMRPRSSHNLTRLPVIGTPLTEESSGAGSDLLAGSQTYLLVQTCPVRDYTLGIGDVRGACNLGCCGERG